MQPVTIANFRGVFFCNFVTSLFHHSVLVDLNVCDDALMELVNHYANRKLFLLLGIAPKSRAKVCAQWRILKPPGSLLATDRSKAVVLV